MKIDEITQWKLWLYFYMAKFTYPKLIDRDDLQYLKEVGYDGPVVSVYIPNKQDEDFHTVWDSLMAIGKGQILSSELKEEAKKEAVQELEKINEFLHELKEFDYYNTLIFFARREKFFKSFYITETLEKDIKISEIPYLDPVENIYEKDGEIFVALVDRTKTEFFSLKWDRFDKDYGLTEFDVPQKIKGGSESWKGLKEKNVLRHIDWHLHEHLKKSAAELFKIWQKEKFQKLIIGGHENVLPKFEKRLHSYLKPLIIERFHAEPDIFLMEVKKDGKKAIDKYIL